MRNARSLKRLVCLLVIGFLLGLTVSCAASEIEKPATASLPKTPQLSDLEQRKTVSQYGITWTFDKAVPVGQFVTGDYYVVGPVTVVDITPKPVLDRSGGVESGEALDSRGWMSKRNVKVEVKARNGSMLNLQVEKEKTGFDSRAPGKRFDASLFTPLPIKMAPGDSLVSTISVEKTRTIPRMLDTDVKTISPVRVGAVLTCMAGSVPPDAFRPAFCDKSNKVYLARNLRRDLLPSLPRPTCTAGLPRKDVLFRVRLQKWDVTALEIWERVYQRPWIDTVTFEFCQPVENMADYGREISRAGGITTLLLCCDFKPEEKEKLLTNFVQVGIDLWGAVRAGHKGWPAVGGHGGGRKWIIVFSGIMLGDKDGRDVPLYEPRKQLSIPPERVASACRWMKKAAARPVFLTLSPCFMKTVSGWDQATRDRLYPEYVKHCDVAGVAVRAIPGGLTRPVRPGTADAVSELRAIDAGKGRFADEFAASAVHVYKLSGRHATVK